MAIYKWNLFGTEIQEEIKSLPNMDNMNILSSESENYYEISDAILESFYVYSLRKIYVSENKSMVKPRINMLNELDGLLNSWVNNGKMLISSLISDYENIEGEDDETTQNVVKLYADEVYRTLRTGEIHYSKLEQLREELLSLDRINNKHLNKYLEELNSLIVKYPSNRKNRTTIYSKLRQLPMYLGYIYEKRYHLYKRLLEYKQKTKAPKSPTVIYLLIRKDFFHIYLVQHRNLWDTYLNLGL